MRIWVTQTLISVRAKCLYLKLPWKVEFFSAKKKKSQIFLISSRHLDLIYFWINMVTSVKLACNFSCAKPSDACEWLDPKVAYNWLHLIRDRDRQWCDETELGLLVCLTHTVFVWRTLLLMDLLILSVGSIWDEEHFLHQSCACGMARTTEIHLWTTVSAWHQLLPVLPG